MRQGLENYLEIRFFNGRLHLKSVMIGHPLPIMGSQDFHNSSISENGLNEFNITIETPGALDIYQELFEYCCQREIPIEVAK